MQRKLKMGRINISCYIYISYISYILYLPSYFKQGAVATLSEKINFYSESLK